MKKLKSAFWWCVGFATTGKLGRRAQYIKMRIKNRHRRQNTIRENIDQVRFDRGEKKYYLGDSEMFVWARNEANAQRKMKAKLTALKDDYEKRNQDQRDQG